MLPKKLTISHLVVMSAVLMYMTIVFTDIISGATGNQLISDKLMDFVYKYTEVTIIMYSAKSGVENSVAKYRQSQVDCSETVS